MPLQSVGTGYPAVATGTTLLPYDDTIPQNNEGDQYMTQAITPKATTNVLTVSGVAYLSHSAANAHFTVALFQDSVASALGAVSAYMLTAGGDVVVPFSFPVVGGTISATTFKIRIGSSTVGTTTFNGVSGGRFFGAINKSSIKIIEHKA